MHELDPLEIRRVAAAMYQPEPWDTRTSTQRNPLYHYLDATAPQQLPTTAEVITV